MPLSVIQDNLWQLSEPAVTVDPTVAHRFTGLQLYELSAKRVSAVKKIQQNHQREKGHLDKPTLGK
jgi:hypothetical protein